MELIFEVIILITTYCISIKVREWWHSPIELFHFLPNYLTCSKMRFLLLHLSFGLFTYSVLSWLGINHVEWNFYFSHILISGVILLCFMSFHKKFL